VQIPWPLSFAPLNTVGRTTRVLVANTHQISGCSSALTSKHKQRDTNHRNCVAAFLKALKTIPHFTTQLHVLSELWADEKNTWILCGEPELLPHGDERAFRTESSGHWSLDCGGGLAITTHSSDPTTDLGSAQTGKFLKKRKREKEKELCFSAGYLAL
jgi:hypothetical protein